MRRRSVLYERDLQASLHVADRGDWRVSAFAQRTVRNTWMGGTAVRLAQTVLAGGLLLIATRDRDESTAARPAILLTLAILRGDDDTAMSIARKLKADQPDDWDERDMTAVGAAAEPASARRTSSSARSGVSLGECATSRPLNPAQQYDIGTMGS